MHIFIYSRKNKANDYLIKSKHMSYGEKEKKISTMLSVFTVENRTKLTGV